MATELTSPLSLPCGATLANRLVKAAMTEGLADPHDNATTAHETLYRRWSDGGAGLLITGNVMVDRRFLERAGNVVIDDERNLAALEAWARAGTAAGNHLWMQISHPGRQCTRMSSREPMCPSSVQLSLAGMFARPRAMTEQQIADAIARFAHVARTARETGFTGVQVHAAHGYLISQFLSPVTNRRDDRWGGSLENRARFLLETVSGVRAVVGDDYPVAVKLNSADFQKGGFSLEDCVRVAGWLGEAGIDLLEVSGGTYEQPAFVSGGDGRSDRRDSTRRREAYFLQYAGAIRAATSVPLMVTGGFRSLDAMRRAVNDDGLGAIGLARPFCVVPDLPRRLFSGEMSVAPTPEDGLRLGPGIFAPTTGIGTLRALNTQAAAAWFYRQIVALSQGNSPDMHLSALRALGQHAANEWRLSRARRFRG